MTDPATVAAMMADWTDWLALTLALAFTIACIVLACTASRDDLDDTLHELELDELWADVEWIEPA